MRANFYLLGLAMITTGLLGAIGNTLTGDYMPWLWCAAAGVLTIGLTSLADDEPWLFWFGTPEEEEDCARIDQELDEEAAIQRTIDASLTAIHNELDRTDRTTK